MIEEICLYTLQRERRRPSLTQLTAMKEKEAAKIGRSRASSSKSQTEGAASASVHEGNPGQKSSVRKEEN